MEKRKTFGPKGVKLVRKLVEARKALGFSLEELSARTRIRKTFLESIEADDLTFLPSVYVHVFLKKYARTVGFKDRELLESCRKEFGIPDPSALGKNEGPAIRDEELANVFEGEKNFGAFVSENVWKDPEPETGRPLWLDDLMRSRGIPVAAIVVGSLVVVLSLGALVHAVSLPSPETPVEVNALASSAQGVQNVAADHTAVAEAEPDGDDLKPGDASAAEGKASVPCPEWTGSEYVRRATFSTRVDRSRREPVDSVCRLSAEAREVFYFSEVLNQEGRKLYHVWEHGESTVRKIPVGKAGGKSWRVWSKKSLGPGMTGTWTVKVVNGDGEVLHSERFEYATR